MFINMFGFAQDLPKTNEPIKPKKERDSLRSLNLDNLLNEPLNTKETDSTEQDSVPAKQEKLTDKINYKAKDYVSINQKEQKIYLYNEAQVIYGDKQINAGIIVIDYSKNEVYAGRIKDSLGEYTQLPVFKQGADVVEPDSIRFNFDTKKALIFNSRTEQSGGFIDSELTKKENDSVYFVRRAKFTTSKDKENPEYYFLLRKAKIVPGKKVVTGLTNMYIADVPTPIGLPFAFFPLTKKRTSGVIFPSFGQDGGSTDRGYFLQNGGYYFAVSDYFDLAVLGDYYTNGSYATRLESNYASRYNFSGNLSFRYERLIDSERGFPDYAVASNYNIRWSHSQDAKANPSSRFSASVNLGSSQFFRQSLNQLNFSNIQNNNFSSSISYSKTFEGEPQVNFGVTATHTQNTNTEAIDMTLPTIQGSVSRIFPFAPKTGSKKGIIQNINLQYNLRAENRITTTDSLFFKKEMFDDALLGFQHSVPVSTNFKLFKYLSLTAGGNFNEVWTFNTINRFQDSESLEIVTQDLKGFDAFRTYNFSANLGTTLYGMFNFGEDKKIQAIRHVMRPSISYNINPAFDKYYDTYEVVSADGLTTEDVDFTRFEGSIFGVPGRNFSSSVGLSLGNNFEAKVRDSDSTATEAKKITILSNLNFTTAYNLAGDSLQWNPIRMTGGTQILNNKVNINFGATFDPYALDSNNNRIDKFNIDNGGSLFRLTSANFTTGYSFNSSTFSGGKDDASSRASQESLRSGGRDDDLFGRPEDFANNLFNDEADDDEEDEKSELYNYKVPWSIRLAYALNYSNTRRENEISSHSLMFSGDIDLSPRWSFSASSGYDIKNQGFTLTRFTFTRDLLSWRMNFSWTPFGEFTSWNFFIGIKSSILRDIKYDQRRQPDRQL